MPPPARRRPAPLFPALAAAALVLGLAGSAAGQGALTVYGGRFSDNHWEDFFLSPPSIDFRNAWLLVVAPSWEIARPHPRLGLEVEGQLGRHFWGQEHWEVNALVAARYYLTDPDARVRSSLAFGLGPSWASETPVLERRISDNGDSARWLVYWYMEGTLAPRSWGPWSAVARLHHRSGAYGRVAEAGGSNIPSLGLRREF